MRPVKLNTMRADKRAFRVRAKLRRQRETGSVALRLSVHRSNLHISVQLIDDAKGVTLAAASTMEKALREQFKTGANMKAAEKIGQLVAERALASGHSEAVFDRGSFRYHGRVKALAEAARAAGMKF